MKKSFLLIVMFLLCCSNGVMASHIVGGDFTYKFLGDTTFDGVLHHKYRVTLYIYQDCINGVPEAIRDDNPAYFTAYVNGSTIPFSIDTNVRYSTEPGSGGTIEVPPNFSNDCVKNIPQLCLQRQRFEKTYFFPASASGYTVVYQRCCRNSTIINVLDPGDEGATYFCTIPSSVVRNNSAVFTNYPPQIICQNNPLYYDHSATDADGDSLSYEFCAANVGATNSDIKPRRAMPPPFDTVKYFMPFTFDKPISGFPSIKIDPKTGIISGTPNRIGRYLVTVCCNEWREGELINTIKREFQFVVTNCSKVVVADIPLFSDAPNTYIVNCRDYDVDFVNTSTGGFEYYWDFGVEGSTSDVSTSFQPSFVYPDTGTYAVKLIVNPGSTCPDSITRLVKIYPEFYSSFVDSGIYCPGSTVFFSDRSISTLKPITKWEWNFGDGATSTEQNPSHSFAAGGTYNVILISENIKNCVDTSLERVLIQNFEPFAGNDTIVVRGETIQFDAKGGIEYAWSPPDYLTDTSISNPRGSYMDTGYHTYVVYVKSFFGCSGYDTMNVWVVNQPSFVVPNAFTPNGDGLNDVFRPRSVGYQSLKFFRVYNRWGEEVYFGKSLETGWDGRHNGRAAEVGVYFWQIRFVDRFGNEGFMKGDVTLIR